MFYFVDFLCGVCKILIIIKGFGKSWGNFCICWRVGNDFVDVYF